jgi:hypothetical protein
MKYVFLLRHEYQPVNIVCGNNAGNSETNK